MNTLLDTSTLVIEECCECHTRFAMTTDLNTQRRDDHKLFYCPNGHSQYYSGKSEKERLREELEREKRRRGWSEASLTATRDQLQASERSRAALRGHLTRARNKIANGVCPVGNCRRHFDNVQEHIATEHPQWHVTDPETGKAAVL